MSLTAIVKPTNDCNLACKYCYVEDCAEKGYMDVDTLANTINKIVEFRQGDVHFLWHGGEPLLAGIQFYRKVEEIQQQTGHRETISNSIQTNGTLVTDELLDFIVETRDYKLGFSLDGPKEVNDLARLRKDGTGAFEDIFEGIERTRHRYPPGCGGAIFVANGLNITYLRQVFEFFNRIRCSFKINAIIDPVHPEFGMSPVAYGKAMMDLFDRWFYDDDAVDVEPFSQIVANLMAGCAIGCNFIESCRDGFISIGPQGDIYPCGRFDGMPEFWMGNINDEDGLRKALDSEPQRAMRLRTPDRVPGCNECEFVNICYSGCPHNALTAGNILGRDPYCSSYKMLFAHIKKAVIVQLESARTDDTNIPMEVQT